MYMVEYQLILSAFKIPTVLKYSTNVLAKEKVFLFTYLISTYLISAWI